MMNNRQIDRQIDRQIKNKISSRISRCKGDEYYKQRSKVKRAGWNKENMTSLKTLINKFYKENYFCRIEDGNHKKDEKKKRKENNIINSNNHHKSAKNYKA